MRRLYDLTVHHQGRDLQVITTHLDLNEDEPKLRDLLFDACRRHGCQPSAVGDFALVVREHGQGREELTYVTTEES